MTNSKESSPRNCRRRSLVADTVPVSIVLYPSPTKQGEASVFPTWRIHGRNLEATLAPSSSGHGAMAPLWPALWPTLTVSRTARTHKFIILGDMTNLLAGSFRKRLQIPSRGNSYTFQVWDLDDWLKSLDEVLRKYLRP